MNRKRNRTRLKRRMQNRDPVSARGVRHELALLPSANRRDPAHPARQFVIGHGKQNQLGSLNDLGHVQMRDTRQQRGDPLLGILTDTTSADDRVTSRAQSTSEDGAYSPGPYDTDTQSPWSCRHP